MNKRNRGRVIGCVDQELQTIVLVALNHDPRDRPEPGELVVISTGTESPIDDRVAALERRLGQNVSDTGPLEERLCHIESTLFPVR